MTITPDAIWQAADALDAEGIRPTLAAVRQKLGAGSFSTISEAMGQWRAHRQQTALHPKEPPPAALGERLSALGAEVWAMARALADEQLAGERQRLETEQADLRSQMAEAVQLADRLTEEVDGLRTRLGIEQDQGLVERKALHVELEVLKERLAELERRSADDLARAAEQITRQEAAAAEARAAEKTALDRAAHAEGELAALKGQLAELTAIPRTDEPDTRKPPSRPRRRGRTAENAPRG